jgi:amino acid adenylation domain-containing protein
METNRETAQPMLIESPPYKTGVTNDLLDWLTETGRQHRQKVAIEGPDRSVSYGELHERANQVAHCLLDNGVSPGSNVVVLLEDRLALITAMIGIFRAGCVFVPLDPDAPVARLRSIVEDLAPRLLVIGGQYHALARDLFGSTAGVQVLSMDGSGTPDLGDGLRPIGRSLDDACTELPDLSVDPDAPAYVYFTSGSTGQPKGIVGRMKGLFNFVKWETKTFGLAPSCRISQLTTPTFDAFFRDVLVPLCAGGTVCLPPSKTQNLGANDLVDWIDRSRVELIHCVPSLFATLLGGNLDAGRFAHLRHILMSGEVLHVANVRTWMDTFGDRIALVNFYGASEATMIQLHHFVVAEDVDRGFIPIGKPIAGVEALLLDDQLNACPDGTEGEIYIDSPYLTLGYHKNAQATKQAFVPHPLDAHAEHPVYKTGDIAVRLDDGNLKFLGRRDRQVKLRGIRIELGAIESQLLRHERIQSCAVVVRETAQKNLIAKQSLQETSTDGSDQKRLVAYVVATDRVTTSELRAHLERTLPSYMIPAQFVTLDKLPLTSSGKVDTRALPDPGEMRPDLANEFVMPETELEIAIADIWREILGLDQVGTQDSFFDLGGDSLKAMQTLNRFRRALGARVTIAQLFELRTIERLARHVEESRKDAEEAARPAKAISKPKRAFYPLSRAQRGLWFLWRMEPDNPYYTSQGTVYLKGELDLNVFRQAWKALLDRHQMLRVRFGVHEGEPVQSFDAWTDVEIPVTDLSGLSAEEREQRLAEAARRETERPFDLENERLIRFQLFKLSEREHVLATAVHEITVDLWSVRELMRDLSALYDGFLNGNQTPLPPLAMEFSDYVLWEEEELTREKLEDKERYWKNTLHGELPVLSLPLDRPRPKRPTYRGAKQNVLLDAELSNRLRALSRDTNSTLFMTVLTAFKVLLHRYTGQNDLIVGAPLSNRTDGDRERLVGFFLNMLPLRSDFSADPSFRELLGSVRQTVTGAISNADYPFLWMLEWVKAVRDTGSAPVFQVMFNMLSFTDVQLKKQDLEIAYRGHETGFTKYDISFYAQEYGDQLFMQMTYLQDLFEDVTIERMLANMQVLLRDIVLHPDKPVSQLELLRAEEKSLLLDDLNATNVDFADSRTVHELFEAQVAKTPEDTALIFGEETLTYRELNERANQVARHLRRNGVGKNAVVALCLERSFDTLVGVLAVQKAGAAYVALDPSYPYLRLAGMIEDAKPRVLLAHRDCDIFDDFAGTKIHIDADWDEIRKEETGNLDALTSPQDLFNIVYTSSTTGNPKGVEIVARAVLNRLHWMWNTHPFRAGDVAVLQKSYVLVASTWELFGGLLKGVPTVILSQPDLLDPKMLWNTVVDRNVSYLLATPSLLQGVLSQAKSETRRWDTLRLATTSAEPLPVRMAEEWRHTFPDVPLLNLYGSTECASNVTSFDARQTPEDAERVPIGRPLSNIRVYILDDKLQPVPAGVTGQLCVAGACLARDYLNLPELTASRFVSDPFSDRSDERLYLTGDLARYRHDGNIELMGRMDHQVKIRGFRVDPSGIEETLLRHDQVEKCVVVLFGEEDDKRLVAYTVCKSKGISTELRDYLRQRLPEYMVPAELIELDSLPLTPNGKVDRRALPAPESVRDESDYHFVGPRNDLELRISLLWEKLLNRQNIGVTQNFFDIGGHSLLAVRLVHEIETGLGQRMDLAALFLAPTIEGIARTLQKQGQPSSSSALVPLKADGTRPPLFCICGVHLYNALAQQLDADQPVYAIFLEMELQAMEARQRGDESTGYPSVETIAAAYLEAIKTVQPRGPYYLSGVSFGGTIAFEIAQQLEARGDTVGLVALFDTSRGKAHKRSLWHRAARHWKHFKRFGPGYVGTVLAQKLRPRLPAGEAASSSEAAEEAALLGIRQELYLNASRNYQARPYGGRLLLFRAQDRPIWETDPDPLLGWGDIATGELEVNDVPGTHIGMLRMPTVAEWASQLSERLKQAQAEASSH